MQALQTFASRGSTFVQWGSSTCAVSSELVYSGVVAGSWYDHYGSADNALCLSLTPTLQDWPSNLHYYAVVNGAEYQTSDTHLDTNPVCAVCRAPQPTTITTDSSGSCLSATVSICCLTYSLVLCSVTPNK
ncbi:hypothetical protein ACOMHN_029737 [Nucella lapillus]